MTHQHCFALPSEAEDEKGDAEESCHSMPDQGSGVARTEVEAKPEGSSQGKKLTRQKIHLSLEKIRNVQTYSRKHELSSYYSEEPLFLPSITPIVFKKCNKKTNQFHLTLVGTPPFVSRTNSRKPLI